MKEEAIDKKYAKAIDPLSGSVMTVPFEEVDNWIEGRFDVDSFTDEQLRTVIAILGTYLLEQDESAQAYGCFVSA